MSKQDEKWSNGLQKFPNAWKVSGDWPGILIEHSDGVEICYSPKGRSKYRIRFDDGVYQGEYRFIIHQDQLTPLGVYLLCAKTGWPGFQLEWLGNLAETHMIEEMAKIKEREAQPPITLDDIVAIHNQNKTT